LNIGNTARGTIKKSPSVCEASKAELPFLELTLTLKTVKATVRGFETCM
jgi:hypothetical protein